jgi:CubicO group peptidase (beta-lactamase class C family)
MRRIDGPGITAKVLESYLWWLAGNSTYRAFGIFGQSIQIFPQQNVVIVMQSFWPASGGSALAGHRTAVTNAILATVM